MKQLEFTVSPTWLRLDGYHVNELHVKINDEFDGGDLVMATGFHPQIKEPLHTKSATIDINFKAAGHESDPRKHRIDLIVSSTKDEESETTPYEYLISISGYFTVHKDFELSEDAHNLMLRTGAATIYGICREILRGNTALGPYPAVVLPSVSFSFTEVEKPQTRAATVKSGTKKKKTTNKTVRSK